MPTFENPLHVLRAVFYDDHAFLKNLPYMQRQIFAAMNIARTAHAGQMYGPEPYFNHVFDAANLARHMGYNAQTVTAALLHDTVEDTSMTLDRLRSAGMSPSVVAAIDAVTFDDDADNPDGLTAEPRRQLKLAKAKRTPLGHVVKFCDSSVNFGHTVSYPWMLRWDGEKPGEYALDYVPNLAELSQDLPTPAEVKTYTADSDQGWCADRFLDKDGAGEHGLSGWNGQTRSHVPHIHDELPHWTNSRWTRIEKRIARERYRLARSNHRMMDPAYTHPD
jgi:hypothetical protein